MFACRKQDCSSLLEIGKFFSFWRGVGKIVVTVLKRFNKMVIWVTTRYCKLGQNSIFELIQKSKLDWQSKSLKLFMKCVKIGTMNWISMLSLESMPHSCGAIVKQSKDIYLFQWGRWPTVSSALILVIAMVNKFCTFWNSLGKMIQMFFFSGQI